MHLPLTYGRTVIFWSLISHVTAFLSWMVGMQGVAFVLERADDTFNLPRFASVSDRFFFLMAESVAVMMSAIGKCCAVMAKLNLLGRTYFSSWVSSLSERFLTNLSYVTSSVK